MLVRCIETGIFNGSRVRPGTVFDWPGEKLPKWVEPADAVSKGDPDEIAGKRVKRPQTRHDEVI